MQFPIVFHIITGIINVMKYLRHIRDKRGISQDKLAELSGVPQNTISRIERGERTPRRSTLDKLARVLEVEHPSWLAMPVSPNETFGEFIEGTPEERRTYIEFMRESGTLADFVKRLGEIYEAGMENYRDDPRVFGGLQAVFMLGYAKAMHEGRDAQEEASGE
jgi:transcriptional regulator with XRE-family HTH domain